MGSGRTALQKPPSRQGTDIGRQTTEDRGRINVRCLFSDSCLPRSKTGCRRLGNGGDRDGTIRPLSSVFRSLASVGHKSNQAERAISTGQLHALPRFHIRPINVVVFHGSSGRNGFEAGFPLRCLQRLSIPHIATLHCGWRHNRSTRDVFTPVLSY